MLKDMQQRTTNRNFTTLIVIALILGSTLGCARISELVKKALANGATHAMDPKDHGFMYGWSFYDLDGHHWEVMWMDPAVANG